MICVLKENAAQAAPKWDRWHAIDPYTGQVVARGTNRWTAALTARERGYEEETNLERFKRRGNR